MKLITFEMGITDVIGILEIIEKKKTGNRESV